MHKALWIGDATPQRSVCTNPELSRPGKAVPNGSLVENMCIKWEFLVTILNAKAKGMLVQKKTNSAPLPPKNE